MAEQPIKSPRKSVGFKAAPEFYDLLGSPYFAPSDDPCQFQLVVERLVDEIQPVGFLEHMITIDLIDATWRELCLRHAREAIKAQSRRRAVDDLLHRKHIEESWTGADPITREKIRKDFNAWKEGKEKRLQIEAMLNKDSVEPDYAILVQTYISSYDSLESIERAIQSAYRVRMTLLRDLDFCRERKKKITKVSDDIAATAALPSK
jgi:hypothetical protein